jgi:hypothetical protein
MHAGHGIKELVQVVVPTTGWWHLVVHCTFIGGGPQQLLQPVSGEVPANFLLWPHLQVHSLHREQ